MSSQIQSTITTALWLLLVLCTIASAIESISPTIPTISILEPQELSHLKIPINLASFSLLPPKVVGLEAYLTMSNPPEACTIPVNSKDLTDTIVLTNRGGCLFQDKVINLKKAGAVGYLISNIVDDTFPLPVWGDPSKPQQFLPLIGGIILGQDGNTLKDLLDANIPVRIRISLEESPRAM